jgi:predicted TPR repeat methyltransferase
MSSTQLSSGDVIADRRADYARMMAEGGDPAAAAELMEQALELAPLWAAGWFRLGEYAEKAGEAEKAAAAFARVVELDPQDIFGAGLKLALLGRSPEPERPSSRYVERLFDDYAARFDEALVERLGYSVPGKLAALVRATGRRFETAVDLGCGTGLLGVEIRNVVARLEGYDLSRNMLREAAEKQVYDHLAQADLSLDPEGSGLFTAGFSPARADLVGAADVLMYLGNLDPPLHLARTLLHPGGLFAFSVEDAGDGDGFLLRPSLRFAHTAPYVRTRLTENRFRLVEEMRTVIRQDAGEDVLGILYLAEAV